LNAVTVICQRGPCVALGRSCDLPQSENDLHKGQTADYIYLNGRPIGEVNPTTGKLYFTHTDRLGTPQKLTDSTQAVAWSATYQPFGNTVSFSGTLSTQSLRLPGQQFDAETGYNHNGFRDYAGGLTRYVESDPIGLAGGLNTYGYAFDNPAVRIDPFGLQSSDSMNDYDDPAKMAKEHENQLKLGDWLEKTGTGVLPLAKEVSGSLGMASGIKEGEEAFAEIVKIIGRALGEEMGLPNNQVTASTKEPEQCPIIRNGGATEPNYPGLSIIVHESSSQKLTHASSFDTPLPGAGPTSP